MSLPKVLHLVNAKARVQIQVLKTLQSTCSTFSFSANVYAEYQQIIIRSKFLKVYVTCVSRDFMLLFHVLRQPRVPHIFMKTLPF